MGTIQLEGSVAALQISVFHCFSSLPKLTRSTTLFNLYVSVERGREYSPFTFFSSEGGLDALELRLLLCAKLTTSLLPQRVRKITVSPHIWRDCFDFSTVV